MLVRREPRLVGALVVALELLRGSALLLNHRRRLITAGLLGVTLMVSTTPALAKGSHATAPKLVSGENLVPDDGTEGECGSDTSHQEWESEPSLSVHPTNADNL